MADLQCCQNININLENVTTKAYGNINHTFGTLRTVLPGKSTYQ